nr:junctional sarcoplasmic reticulum protein 1-like [Ipomoea batatas]
MKQPSFGSRRHEHDEEPDFNLTDWGLKAKISRENTNSRRFSASYIRSFREDAKSFRSNLTISSTASSPGYNLKEEIDPSTYSFTTALKALQAKTVYSWEYMSPEGLALNSKWDEAEKYICNPLSGEVPMECLSAKTLSGRSFRQLTSRITMSAPLIYPARQAPKPPMPPPLEINQPHTPIPTQEKKIGVTRDVGTQSGTPPLPYLGSSSSPSPAPTPSIEERSIKRHASESPSSWSDISTAMKLIQIRSQSIHQLLHSAYDISTTMRLIQIRQDSDEDQLLYGERSGVGLDGTYES